MIRYSVGAEWGTMLQGSSSSSSSSNSRKSSSIKNSSNMVWRTRALHLVPVVWRTRALHQLPDPRTLQIHLVLLPAMLLLPLLSLMLALLLHH